MFIHCELVVLILALTLDGQVHTGEIIHGHEAVPHSRPYMVLVEKHFPNAPTRRCGGFILNEDFVMTAAHCQASTYTVLLGVHDATSKNIQRVPVDQAFPHKDYDKETVKNDIMLLKMSSKISFSKNVRPIALADQDDGSLPKSCSVAGWGKTEEDAKYLSNKLMEVNVTLIDDERCRQANSYCSKGETGPNVGDSGGPLVCEDEKAYGVISYIMKPHSGGPQIYVYSKIPDAKRWIEILKNA